MTTNYLCPLCEKNTAYVSPYGLADSVICRCQGLNEVGRLVNDSYIPNKIEKQVPVSNGMSFIVGSYTFSKLDTEDDLRSAGILFNNSLQVASQRQRCLKNGSVWTAIHDSDPNRNIILFVTNDKILLYLHIRSNFTPLEEDKNFVLDVLVKKDIIIKP